MEKLLDLLESLPMTLIGGVMLLASFLLPRLGVTLPIDPAWITVIICGLPLLFSAIKKLIFKKGISKISSALLISIAMIAAICIGDLFAAGEVAFIMAIGEILEDLTTARAKRGLKKLIALTPATARLIKNGKEEIVPADSVKVGDIIRILPGETVPADGVIIDGETSADQSVMTGESLPVDKSVGDEMYCGTVNRFGAVDIKATKVADDSSLGKLIRMVKEAQNKKAPMARTADKAAALLVPAALLIAIITGIVTKDIVRAVTVLVVFCPCALVLATPTAIMAAIGQATKHGVIIKSGEALEVMGKVDTVCFDKTGTLTCGTLEVCDIITVGGEISESELIRIAASAESKSEHPLAKAVVAYATDSGIIYPDCSDFRMAAGKGVTATSDGKTVSLGSEKYLTDCGAVMTDQVRTELEKLRHDGKATLTVAVGNEIVGIIALSDKLRTDADKAVSKLHGMKTDCVLLTGDSKSAASYFASAAGVTKINAELLPDEKVECIEALKGEGRTVAMIGDGVNDAPALKSADVGIAMGGAGSDIAVDAADIALVGDDIGKLPYLKRLAKATVATVKFSITLSMVINIAAVILSVLGVLTPTTGALVHNAGSVFVVLIAAMLYDRKFK